MKFSKIYNYEERLVRFAGEAALFTETLKKQIKKFITASSL
jgi:hypothetical protein